MRKTILLSLFALLLAPTLAAAGERPVPAPAPLIESQGCDAGLSFLGAAPETPAAGFLTALSPLAEAQQTAASCCTGRRIACQAVCAPCGGIFEFNCDPATCQSSCICNISP
jgi:hypothetical protein